MLPPSLDTVFDHLPFSVAIVDATNRVVRANEAMRGMLGLEADNLIGEELPFTIVPEDDRDQIRGAISAARNGECTPVTFRFVHPDGSAGLAMLSVKPIETADGMLLISFLDRTDHGYAEANLVQSESLYRSFLEQSPMGVLHLDAVGNVTFENQQFRRILGNDPRFTWVEKNIRTAPGLDKRLTPELVSLLLEGQPFANRSVSIVRPDDTVAELVVFGSPIRRAGEKIVGGVLMFQDRTQQFAQERELAVRDRFRKAESLLRGSAVVGTEEDEYLSHAAQILGTSIDADELVVLTYNMHDRSCRIGARWARQESGDISPDLSRVAVEGNAGEGEGVLHIDEASLRDLLSAGDRDEVLWMPFHGASDLGGFVVFRLDAESSSLPISRDQLLHLLDTLIRTFETLWETVQLGARYRLAVSTIDDGLFTYQLSADNERRYTFVSPQFKALLGVSIQRILAPDLPTTWFDSGIDEAGRVSLIQHYEELEAERPSVVMYSYTQPNGKVCWLREDSTPHHSPTGTLVVSGMLSDVTAQQAAEQVLIRGKDAAMAEARRKTSFLSTMSHELRTPLGTVNGFASMLNRELTELASSLDLPSELADFAEAIETRSRELLDFVDDLLDLSNLESGLLTMQRGLVDVNEVVQRALEPLQATLEANMIQIHVRIPQGLFASGDAQRLSRVLRKVLDNAVKFTDSGGSITVQASGDASTVKLEISDTGIGIDPLQLDRVASPFVQVDDRLNRTYEGKGIGLTVAKRLIEAMSGRFEIVSQPGAGTTVLMQLPAVESVTARSSKED